MSGPEDPKPPKKGKSRWADEPYGVGKGKPPVESQFKKGAKSPNPKGRPKGTRNRKTMDKLQDELVSIGRDARNRVIKKPLGEVIDRVLLGKAAKGDMYAIRLRNEFEVRLASIRARSSPDPEETRKQLIVEQERTAKAAKMMKLIGSTFDAIAGLKKMGLIELVDDRIVVQPWAREAAAKRGFGGGQ